MSKRLIVGLGNPGREYDGTRHNVGFDVVDALARRAGITFKNDKGSTLAGWGRLRGRPVGLAKPQTYMNRSGGAVVALTQYYKIPLEDVLVVYDDLNLDVGVLRLREQGSAGGHNGVQDIIDKTGTDAFPRLRVGIGSDFRRGAQVDYVLAPFGPGQREAIEEGIAFACEAVETFVTEGLTAAMNRFNGR